MKLKELCELNNIEYNTKNPKLSRAKLEQLYVLEQTSKQNYNIIRELTDEEKRDLTTRVKMRDTIKDMICTSLSLVNGNTLCGSIKEYYELFALVNSNFKWFTYKDNSNKKKEYLDIHNIDASNDIIYSDFAIEVDNMFRRIVKETFEELQKELLIYVNKHLVFVYRKNGYKLSKVADNDDIEEWLKVCKGILLEYGYDNYDDIPYYDKINIKNKISKELNIEYFYYEYELILNREHIKNNSTKCNNAELKQRVNKMSINKLSKSKQGILKEYDIEMLNDCINTLIKIEKE